MENIFLQLCAGSALAVATLTATTVILNKLLGILMERSLARDKEQGARDTEALITRLNHESDMQLAKFKLEAERGTQFELAKFNQESHRDIQIQLEKVKADLRGSEIAKETSFPRIYAKQCETIEQLYEKLLEMQSLCSSIAWGWIDTTPDEGRIKFRTIYLATKNQFLRSNIYLPKALSDKLSSVIERITKLSHDDSMVEMKLARKQSDDLTWKKIWDTKDALLKEMEHDLPSIMDELRGYLRHQLGVEDLPKSN